MNKFFTSIILLIGTVAIVSCSKKKDDIIVEEVEVKRPFADYSIVPGNDPLTFKFENKSSNYKTLEWRFGDDSLSTEVSPTHVYLKPGLFEVNLKATSEDGSTARKLLVIRIVADSIANFVAAKTGVPNTIKFSATSKTTIKSFLWDFGDGTTSTDPNPVKAYPAGTFINASLTMVTDKGSKITVVRKVTSKGSLVDVTNKYMLNTGPGFIPVERETRWGILADWYVNDAVKQRTGNMGSWDSYQGGQWLSLESWKNEKAIVNGKISQTMTLPAGAYFFNAIYRDYTITSSGKTYMVIAEGDMLPDVDKVESSSLGFYRLMDKAPLDLVTYMEITQPTKVTMGLSSTMNTSSSGQTVKCKQVRLYKAYE